MLRRSPWHSGRGARNRPRHRLRSIRESLGWRRLPAPPCGGSHRPPRRILGRCRSCPKVRPPNLRIKPKSMTHRRIEVPSSETICRTAKNFLAEPLATKVPHCLFFRIIRKGLPLIRKGLPLIRKGLPLIRKGLPLIRKGLPCQALHLIDASRQWSCPRIFQLRAKAGLREAGDCTIWLRRDLERRGQALLY